MDSSQTSKPTIRFCVNNPRTLGERNELIARGYDCRDCLGNCSACFEGRFLEIDGEIIDGDSYDEIFRSASADPKTDTE